MLLYFAAAVALILTPLVLFLWFFRELWILRTPALEGSPFSSLPPARGDEPLITEQTSRDRVLKNGFSPAKVPDELDAIVIGSGIGGLTAAATLAKASKKVLVLEQHDQAGGCCHVFAEQGVEFDVGIHYIGEMNEGSFTRLLSDHLTDGKLQWVPLDDVYDTVVIGEDYQKRYPIPAGRERLINSLISHFPDEAKSIRKYFDAVKKARSCSMALGFLKVIPKWLARFLVNTGLIRRMFPSVKWLAKSLRQVLDELTTNEELKTVLYYSFGNYGTAPTSSSFMMHALLVNHFLEGGYYPKGGASEIAFNIIPVIERAGGRVLVRAQVKNLLFSEALDRVVGVRVEKGETSYEIRAPIVISGAGLFNTFKKMIPAEAADRFGLSSLSSGVKPGLGYFSVFIGLDGTKEELGVRATNVWAFKGPDAESLLNQYCNLSAEEAIHSPVPLMFLSFPSAKDPTFNDRYPGKTTCAVITVTPYHWFEEWKDERVMHRGEEYKSLKTAIARQMWNQVIDLYPHLDGKMEYMDVGSPLSNQFYLGSYQGEVYGLDHDLCRFSLEAQVKLRPQTPVPGLCLTGQDVFVCGFSGGMFGGVLCAASILKRNLVADLMTLRKQWKARHGKKS